MLSFLLVWGLLCLSEVSQAYFRDRDSLSQVLGFLELFPSVNYFCAFVFEFLFVAVVT